MRSAPDPGDRHPPSAGPQRLGEPYMVGFAQLEAVGLGSPRVLATYGGSRSGFRPIELSSDDLERRTVLDLDAQQAVGDLGERFGRTRASARRPRPSPPDWWCGTWPTGPGWPSGRGGPGWARTKNGAPAPAPTGSDSEPRASRNSSRENGVRPIDWRSESRSGPEDPEEVHDLAVEVVVGLEGGWGPVQRSRGRTAVGFDVMVALGKEREQPIEMGVFPAVPTEGQPPMGGLGMLHAPGSRNAQERPGHGAARWGLSRGPARGYSRDAGISRRCGSRGSSPAAPSEVIRFDGLGPCAVLGDLHRRFPVPSIKGERERHLESDRRAAQPSDPARCNDAVV